MGEKILPHAEEFVKREFCQSQNLHKSRKTVLFSSIVNSNNRKTAQKTHIQELWRKCELEKPIDLWARVAYYMCCRKAERLRPHHQSKRLRGEQPKGSTYGYQQRH